MAEPRIRPAQLSDPLHELHRPWTPYGLLYFVRAKLEARVIGFLCINFDNSAFRQASQELRRASAYLDALGLSDPIAELNDDATAPEESDVETGTDQSTREVLSVNADEVVTHNIAKFATELGISPARMNRQERMQLISRLDGSGVFLVKGSVDTVARALGISSPSVYRYLHTIRNAAVGPDQST
ncbi:hypothetical protein GKC41_01750 [Bifidobacterium asteroides]|uniref:Transcriptional regulator DauR-like HTH domain-containing protein n=1 Tax=Bifidobacterium asteroides TaxID=1684 RepID=A0A6N7TWF1_9BIFI|nr:hypothetical protein [Bifidobacterium asteroides]